MHMDFALRRSPVDCGSESRRSRTTSRGSCSSSGRPIALSWWRLLGTRARAAVGRRRKLPVAPGKHGGDDGAEEVVVVPGWAWRCLHFATAILATAAALVGAVL